MSFREEQTKTRKRLSGPQAEVWQQEKPSGQLELNQFSGQRKEVEPVVLYCSVSSGPPMEGRVGSAWALHEVTKLHPAGAGCRVRAWDWERCGQVTAVVADTKWRFKARDSVLSNVRIHQYLTIWWLHRSSDCLSSLLCCRRIFVRICVVHSIQNGVRILVRWQRGKAKKEHINSDKDQFWKLYVTSTQVPLTVI